MPQINPQPDSLISRWFKDIFKRLHALEATVPIASDSVYETATFDTASSTFVTDSGVTVVNNIKCFGNKTDGTNVEVIGSCDVGLDSLAAGVATIVISGTSYYYNVFPNPSIGSIGGAIGVQVDGGGTFEPGSGPGIYYLADVQMQGGGIQVTIAGSRVIQVLSPGATQGLSEHSFAMVFRSLYGQTVHFESRTFTINPQ